MDHLYSTTSEHRNGQHLSFEHRLLIQTRLKSGWSYNKIAKEIDFISFVEKKFFKDGWSLDACVGYALKEGLFTRGQIVCTKTLYSYADLGLLGIKNIHLPEKLRRSSKRVKILKNKRVLGRSIEERPLEANDRSEFGHWGVDLVIGSKKKNDDTLLTAHHA